MAYTQGNHASPTFAHVNKHVSKGDLIGMMYLDCQKTCDKVPYQ